MNFSNQTSKQLDQDSHTNTPNNQQQSKEKPKIFFLWGCRYLDKDFYARSWLKHFKNAFGVRAFVVFSRQGPEKHYVQHLIEDDPTEFARLALEKDSKLGKFQILLCGGSKFLPLSIEKAMVKAIASYQKIDSNSAKEIFENFAKNGGYKCESFG